MTDSSMSKTILLEPTGKLHSALETMIKFPPVGYKFQVSTDKTINSIYNLILTSGFFRSINGRGLFPWHLWKPVIERYKKIPKGTCLTFSVGHIVFRDEPWVVELEWVTQLAGFWMKHLVKHRKLIEKYLASENCKKIICMTELTKETVLRHLDCNGFKDKVDVVYRTVPPKPHTERAEISRKVRVMFAGSGNFMNEFQNEKGGLELIRVIDELNKKRNNLEFVIRSDVPPWVKHKFKCVKNVKIINSVLPKQQYENLFRLADIFLLPAHHTPSLAFLDAMSYGLPVVTIDSWANKEIVDDGKTGFVIPLPKEFHLPVADFLPEYDHPVRAVRKVSDETVMGLVEKVNELAEDVELRRKLGENAREVVNSGKFSLHKRNEKLKSIFDSLT